MGAQFQSLSIFLFLLLTFQEIIPNEATVCTAPSTSFHGVCLRSKNCLATCVEEGFSQGECKRFKCQCTKDCDYEPGPPEQGGEGGEEPSPLGQGGEGGEEPGEGMSGPGGDGGEEPATNPAGGGRAKPPSPPEEGGDDDGEEPVAHPPKKAGGGRAKPPVHSRRYLLNN